MCIIAIKPRGAKLPADETLRTMFSHNPDGAGFMFPMNGRVEIRKGFMTYDGFTQALKNVLDRLGEDTPVVMHFRITTHGGTCPENTHPFPLTKDIGAMHRLSTTCEIGVAHNGIIHTVTPRAKDVSDTMEYIADVVYPVWRKNHKFFKTQRILNGIRDTISGSRMCFMTGTGDVYRVGTWVENDGLFYSNESFKPWTHTFVPYTYTYTPKVPVPYSAPSYESDRLPWEDNARIFKNLMPLDYDDMVCDDDGKLQNGDWYAIDRNRRVYAIDCDDCVAILTDAHVVTPVHYDRAKAILFEVA